ncbi:hypothetical protein EG329_010795 [Mollisiaceae sp. DMI_Dod_QoI]|nr:hypothetical protein EG329_010795 [Helotiales sp. DMI_Dod_QoI]
MLLSAGTNKKGKFSTTRLSRAGRASSKIPKLMARLKISLPKKKTANETQTAEHQAEIEGQNTQGGSEEEVPSTVRPAKEGGNNDQAKEAMEVNEDQQQSPNIVDVGEDPAFDARRRAQAFAAHYNEAWGRLTSIR